MLHSEVSSGVSSGTDVRPQETSWLFPVHFGPGQSQIGVDGQAVLEVSARTILVAPASERILIEGHSDGVEGGAEKNDERGRLLLSWARAAAVRDYLVSLGVPRERFIVVGTGSSAPVGGLSSERDGERNRVATLSVVRGIPRTGERTANGVPSSAPGVQTSPGSGVGASASNAVLEAVPVEPSYQGPVDVETVKLGLTLLKRSGAGLAGGETWPIQQSLQREMANIEGKFRDALREDQALQGDTRVLLKIDAVGQVVGAEVGLPHENKRFESEFITYLLTWRLPPPPGQDNLELEMSLSVVATFRAVIPHSR